MNENSHCALIVEDDEATARTLAQYARSLGHRSRIAATLEEVDQAIAEGGHCYVLLDKQIPAEAGAPPLTATGDTALKRLRKVDPRRTAEDAHVLPILVVTGASAKPAFVVKNIQMGGSDFIPKPFDEEIVTAGILTALVRAGREDHAECAALAPLRTDGADELAPPDDSQKIRLVLDGIPVGRRVSFLVNRKRCDLQAARFAVLLQAAAERRRGSYNYLSPNVLGITRSPEVPSRIHEAVARAVPEGFLVLQRGEGGGRRLHPFVVVEPIDWPFFERHYHPGIQRIALAERKRR